MSTIGKTNTEIRHYIYDNGKIVGTLIILGNQVYFYKANAKVPTKSIKMKTLIKLLLEE